ncbi:hypothetical protein ON010_g13998 [Phytophthora cinnamomi]|nr:hypothetical protein ON010_g13998 [Phytophthora cinnamomi]
MLQWHCVLLAVVTFLSIPNALSAAVDGQQAGFLPDQFQTISGTIDGNRFLRGASKVSVTEERLPNMDIIIKDAASKAKKAVIWKIKFAIWKYILGRDPQAARHKLGMGNMGSAVYSHTNHEQLQAYRRFHGEVLAYP